MIQIDIEMPKTCGQCLCAMRDLDYNTARCRLKYDLCFDANSRDYSIRRLDGCPLHEVTDTDTISRPQWIPCSKRLPEVGAVLITDGNEILIGEYYGDSTWSVDGCDYNPDLEKIAWMPLPEPYRP